MFSWSFSSGLNSLLNAIVFALFCISLTVSVKSGRNKLAVSSRKALLTAIWVLVLTVVGTVCSRLLDPGKYGNWIVIAADAVVCLLFVLIYFKRRNRYADMTTSNSIRRSATSSGQVKYALSVLYGSFMVMTLVQVVYFILTFKSPSGDMFVLLPLAASLLSVFLWRLSGWRGFLLVCAMAVLFFASVFLYGTYSNYGFDAAGEILSFTLLYLSLIVPLCDLYCRREEAI